MAETINTYMYSCNDWFLRGTVNIVSWESETLRFKRNKIHCSTGDQSLSDLLYSKTKQKQILENMLRFQ